MVITSQRRFRRQCRTKGLAKGHQPHLQPLHEEHQANNDSEEPAGDDPGVSDLLLQDQQLEQQQIDRQRHHGPHLLHQPDLDIGLSQPVGVDRTQRDARGATGQRIAIPIVQNLGHQIGIRDTVLVDRDLADKGPKTDRCRHLRLLSMT
jgi:hypothetical protein